MIKRILLSFQLFATCIFTYSQHLTFKGININKDITTFIQELENKGFKESKWGSIIPPKPGESDILYGVLYDSEVSLQVNFDTINNVVTEIDVSASFDSERETYKYIYKISTDIEKSYSEIYTESGENTNGVEYKKIGCFNNLNGKNRWCGDIYIFFEFYDSRYRVHIRFVDINAYKDILT